MADARVALAVDDEAKPPVRVAASRQESLGLPEDMPAEMRGALIEKQGR